MGWFLNFTYLFVLLAASPCLLWRRWCKGKRVGGLWQKLTGNIRVVDANEPRVWLHAVSVGEVLLLKPIIHALQSQYPGWEIVLSVTTATGRQVAEQTYPGTTVFWFPFDFTWAVRRALRRVNPRLVLLAELELWPNFIRACLGAEVPVVVVNGRLSARSFRGYRRFRRFMRPVLERVSLFAVQQEEYARRLRRLGVPSHQIHVTGSVKFDGVHADRGHPRVSALRQQLGLEGEERPLIWVVGSTQAPEEAWALEIYRQAKLKFPQLRLILVPRHRERFEEVAALLRGSGTAFLRKSQLPEPPTGFRECAFEDPVILIDTLGELRYVWGLAHLAFVGGSFNDRGGQNMIEPAAYGVPVTFGPNTWNFQHTVDLLLAHEAAVQVRSKQDWLETTLALLGDADRRTQRGWRAQSLVLSQQGATERTLALLRPFLEPPDTQLVAA